MRIPGGENNKWHWPDASAEAQCAIWAGVGGDRLPVEKFYYAMDEAFGVDGQGVNDLLGRLGAKCVLNDVVLRLQQLEPEKLSSVMAELGTLAGGGDDTEKTAAEAGEQLREGATEKAALALRSLSTMATARVARKAGHKGWSLAA